MRVLVIAGVLALAGCAGSGKQLSAESPCIVENGTFFDDGSETEIQMVVAKDAEKCTVAVATIMVRRGSSSGRILTLPQHGTAETLTEPTGLVVRGVGAAVGANLSSSVPGDAAQHALGVSYRPSQGYVGFDEFRFSMAPTRRGPFRVQVRVVDLATAKP